MRVALNPDGSRMFTPEERLNARQIDSYYSRIKVERRDASVKRPKRDAGEDARNEAWEDFDADEAVFEDEEFMSDADRVESTIMDNLDGIFDMNAEMEIMHEELTAVNEPILTIKPENEVFGLPPEVEKQTTSEEDELCGEYGIPADNQEECWEERRIAALAHPTVRAIGNGGELCGKFGIPDDDQEKCWEEQRIAALAHPTVRAIGNGAESGSGTIALSPPGEEFSLPDEIQ